MKTPTVHLNGTAASNLIDDYIGACQAIQDAIKMVINAGPNARDYYPQGDGAFQIAVAEQENRLERLRSVLREMEALAESVAKDRRRKP